MALPYTVLIVEQADSVRWATKQVLSMRGYRVLEAADANEALVVLARQGRHVDLVLIGAVGDLTRGQLRRYRPSAQGAAERPLKKQRVGPESPTRFMTLVP